MAKSKIIPEGGLNQIPAGKKARAVNIELLRIVSMLMVLTVHVDGASVGLPAPDYFEHTASMADQWRWWVEAFTIVGVNCFTMISGYFGIRLRWRSVASYLFQCLFYSVGIFLIFAAVKYAMGNATHFFTWEKLADSFRILSHNNLWYVPAYFLLMLLAPFLNAGVEMMSRRRVTVLTGVMTLMSVWCGWWCDAKFNPTGYTIFQLVNVYLIARTISLYPCLRGEGKEERVTNLSHSKSLYRSMEEESRRGWIVPCAIYLLCVGTIYVSARILPPVKAFAYNSPLVLMASVALFVTFLRMKLNGKWILRLATGAFAVYLIHKNPYVWIEVMCPFVMRMWKEHSLCYFTGVMAVMVPGIYLLCVWIDRIRIWIYTLLMAHISSLIK